MKSLLPRLQNPYLLLTLTVLFWSGNWIVGRGFHGDIPPIALAFWRWAIAFVCVLPLAWPQRRLLWPAWQRHWRILSALSLSGIVAYNTFAYQGLHSTTATNGVLLNAFIPIVIIGLAWIFAGKRLRPRDALGIALSLSGVLTLVAHGQWAQLAQLQLNPGDLWIMASVIAWAAYTVLLQYRPASLPPMALLASLISIGLLVLAPLYLWELALGQRIQTSPAALAGIAYTGLFPAFLGYIFWNHAVAQVGSTRAGLFIHIMPIATPLLAALLLDETLQPYHGAGMVLILSGILIATRRAASAPHNAPPHNP